MVLKSSDEPMFVGQLRQASRSAEAAVVAIISTAAGGVFHLITTVEAAVQSVNDMGLSVLEVWGLTLAVIFVLFLILNVDK